MFKQKENIVRNEEKVNSESGATVGDEIWELNDSEVNEVTESRNAEDVEATFIYPSQSKESECELLKEADFFQCSVCEYKAKTKNELRYHEDEDHNWCWVCDTNFDTKR